jgi:hypothetical protein
MSKLQKLFDRIKHNPNSVRFEELERPLLAYGFTIRQPGSGSSHDTFYKKGCPVILTVPNHRPVNEIYIKKAIQAIDDYGD